MDSAQPREAISSKDINKTVLIKIDGGKWINYKAILTGIVWTKHKAVVRIGAQQYFVSMDKIRILEPRPL